MKIVKDNYMSNMQNMFANSFGFDETEKTASFDFEGANKDIFNEAFSHIEKCAGIKLDNADEESIKESILRYITNEIAIFPVKLGVSIDFVPLAVDKARNNAILDGKGSVNISYQTKSISLPILVQNGDMFPFDVIESEGQRVPFSRENLAKVITGIVKWHKDLNQNTEGLSDGFKGVAEPLNPSTTPGFMGDVMAIRDQHMQKRGPSNLTAVANEYGLDNLLEKTAKMSEITNEEAMAIANVLNEKIYKQAQEKFAELEREDLEFEKTAAEEEDRLKEMEELPFRDISECKHEDVVMFSEETKPGEFQTTKAIVFKTFKRLKDEVKPMTILLSTDGRMKVLKPGEKFECVIAPNETFKVSKTNVESLKEKDIFIAIDGADVFTPLVVERAPDLYRENIDFDGNFKREKTNEKCLEVREIGASDVMEQFADSDNTDNTSLWEKGRFTLFNLNETAFTLIPYNDFIRRKADETGYELNTVQEIFNKDRVCNREYSKKGKILPMGTNVLCADRKFRVVPVTGTIGKSLDIRGIQRVSNALTKTASAMNDSQIRIDLVDRSLKLFNVVIWFKDDTKSMLNKRRKDFQRISEGKVRAILRILKFNPNEASNVIYKAKNNAFVEQKLPSGVTMKDFNPLEGGSMTNVSVQNVKNTINRLVNPNAIATAAATTIATDLIVDVIKSRAMAPGGKNAVRNVHNILRNVVAANEECILEFEKIAMETKSHDMLNIAKTLVLSKEYLEKCANVITETEVYPEFKKVSKEINNAAPLFEKIAYDLVEFNRAQFKNKDRVIAPNIITSAINSLDTMYKMSKIASEVKPMDKVLEL